MGNEPYASDATSRSCPRDSEGSTITYRQYAGEADLPSIMALVQSELSEPYVIYTYRYFLQQWPHLSFLAFSPDSSSSDPVGVIVCKQSMHKDVSNRGYIAMLSVHKGWRKRGIARSLVERSINAMKVHNVEEVVLETEYDNAAALSLYESLGFIREKRLYRFYMNGKDAFRLVLAIPPADILLSESPPTLSPLAITSTLPNSTSPSTPTPSSSANAHMYSILQPPPPRLSTGTTATYTHARPTLAQADINTNLPMSRRHTAIQRVLPAFVSMAAVPFDDDEVSSR